MGLKSKRSTSDFGKRAGNSGPGAPKPTAIQKLKALGTRLFGKQELVKKPTPARGGKPVRQISSG